MVHFYDNENEFFRNVHIKENMTGSSCNKEEMVSTTHLICLLFL
jgi:hypothetical protein